MGGIFWRMISQRFLWNLIIVSMVILCLYRGAPGESRTLASAQEAGILSLSFYRFGRFCIVYAYGLSFFNFEI